MHISRSCFPLKNHRLLDSQMCSLTCPVISLCLTGAGYNRWQSQKYCLSMYNLCIFTVERFCCEKPYSVPYYSISQPDAAYVGTGSIAIVLDGQVGICVNIMLHWTIRNVVFNIEWKLYSSSFKVKNNIYSIYLDIFRTVRHQDLFQIAQSCILIANLISKSK